jgi:hypothetical protein
MARQSGHIALDQALACGLSRRQVDGHLQSGRWTRVHEAVYRSAAWPRTADGDLIAALLTAPNAVASHRSAAALLGMDVVAPARPEITVANERRRRLVGVDVHRTRTLARIDVTTTNGVPHTKTGRTLLDLAAVLSSVDLEAAVDSALRDGLESPAHLARRLVANGVQGRTGARTLVDIVADRSARGVPGSRAELRLERRLVAAGVPDPVRQYELRTDRRAVIRFDWAWPWAHAALEFQSWRFHSARAAWRRDEVRRNRATALGWLVLYATEEHNRPGRAFDTLVRDLLAVVDKRVS